MTNPHTIDAILDEAQATLRETSIIHVADVIPLMKSKFALTNDGDLEAMEAVEHRRGFDRKQLTRVGALA